MNGLSKTENKLIKGMKEGRLYTIKKLSKKAGCHYNYASQQLKWLHSRGYVDPIQENGLKKYRLNGVYTNKYKSKFKSNFEKFSKEALISLFPEFATQIDFEGIPAVFDKEQYHYIFSNLLNSYIQLGSDYK